MRRKGYACPMILKITFPGDNDSVILDLLDSQHDHSVKSVDDASALTEEAKEFIRQSMKINLNPKRIHVLLTVRIRIERKVHVGCAFRRRTW